MTATNGWPGEPGVPLNPERDGWHWLTSDPKAIPIYPSCMSWCSYAGAWRVGNGRVPASQLASNGWRYVCPIITPAEVMVLQARVTELGEALGTLEKAAAYTAKLGAVTGAHWLSLGTALFKARAALGKTQ